MTPDPVTVHGAWGVAQTMAGQNWGAGGPVYPKFGA